MYRGLREHYLKSIQGKVSERVVTRMIQDTFSSMAQETNQWQTLWQTLLKLFFPTMENVQKQGTGGLPRMDEVWSSEPSIFVKDLADFLTHSMFPENGSWLLTEYRTPGGYLVPRSKLDVNTLQFADKILEAMRYWLIESNFYVEIVNTMLHDIILGNSALRCLPSLDEFHVRDVPIHKLSIGRDSAGRVSTLAESYNYPEWELKKMYGQDALKYFNDGQWNAKAMANFKGLPQNIQLSPIPAANPYNLGGYSGLSSTGYSRGSTPKERIYQVIKFYTPNAPWSKIPVPEGFLPEMEYLCFSVAQKTGALLDVEAYPTLNWGIGRDVTVNGETFGRGLGNLLLADVSVLNSKKRVEYNVDAIQSQSPLLVKGSGFVNDPGTNLKPFQKIHLHQNTTMEPLYNRAPLMQRSTASYESEILGLEKGFRREKMDVALADRMTATEYLQRKDSSWGIFGPVAGRIYEQVAKPVLNNLLSWLIFTDRLPPLPLSIAEGGLLFQLKTRSVLTAGQESEIGQKLTRALGPLVPFIERDPSLLDIVDTEGFVRHSMSQFELSEFTRSRESMDERRMARMEEAGGARGTPDPVTQGRNSYISNQEKSDMENLGDGYAVI